jgi:hypothetical protein
MFSYLEVPLLRSLPFLRASVSFTVAEALVSRVVLFS